MSCLSYYLSMSMCVCVLIDMIESIYFIYASGGVPQHVVFVCMSLQF